MGRGDELGVAPSAVWCDVRAFREAVERERPEEALDLYCGDLLEGFFVPSAPEFERWVEEERQRLRSAAAAAAWGVAEREKVAGNGREAVRWARRAVDLAPHDEAGLRRLIGLFEGLGDRASALGAYEDFARRLAEELDLEPSPETDALMRAVRGRREVVATAGAEDREPVPAPEPNVVAVLPFSVRGDSGLGYLREGMVDLVSAKLDGAGELRTVDPHALLCYVRSLPGGEVGPDQGRAVARRFGAGVFMLGSVVASGGRLHVSATMYETRGASQVRADAEADDEAEIMGVVDALVLRLLAERITSLGGQIARLGALTTDSLPALKAHLEAERAFRRGQYFDAVGAGERAVKEDPSFALGHYRLATARAACGMTDAAREASAVAWGERGRLAPHASLLLEAQAAWLRGDAAEAEALYLRLVGDRPESVEAWFLLGNLLFESNVFRGRSVLEARSPLERAASLDPKHVAALSHLVRLAALEGRREDLDELDGRVLVLSPTGDQALAMRGIRAFALDDRAAQEEVLADLAGARPLSVAETFTGIALYGGDLEAAERVARRISEVVPAAVLGALGPITLAHLALARGARAEAMRELAAAEKADRARAAALEHRALFLTLPFLPVEDAELEMARNALTNWRPPSGPPPLRANIALAVHDPLHAHLRLYLLGLVETRLGELDAALAHADECERLEVPSEASPMHRNLALGVRARVALTRGDAAAALALLEETHLGPWFQLAIASPFFALAPERFLRAEALIALDRRDEARGWLEGFAQRSPYELIYRAPARELARSLT